MRQAESGKADISKESPGFYRYWGKARPDGDEGAQFHPLPFHSLDVAAVGVEYLRRARSVRELLEQALGWNANTVENWLAFWLAVHDLGKFSEAFQSQKPELFLTLRKREPNAAKVYGTRHDTLGFLFWKEPLASRIEAEGWFGSRTIDLLDGCDAWARAVTGHHGQPPRDTHESWESHFDRHDDLEAVFAFVEAARERFLVPSVVEAVTAADPDGFEQVSRAVSWWVAGIAVLSDWLGSNTDFFPYCDDACPLDEYWSCAQDRAKLALDSAGVLPEAARAGRSFSELFPGIDMPSPLQHWAMSVELAEGPQIHMLEDVTGAGKTEAAVMLAYRLMAAGEADGFFIGLPTMATANAMYGRIAEVYRTLFAGRPSLVLAHGQRNLVEAFAGTVLPNDPGGPDRDEKDQTASARCTAWLADHNKRALLASAGVGTIDQALLAVLHSRHQSLRLLGLFRKVLIVDEVHACDAYMQRVLETLLEFHARVGGSVILLSATMPRRMKQALLKAFARGRESVAPLGDSDAYPLVTSWVGVAPALLEEAAVATRDVVRRRIDVRYEPRREAVVDAIREAVAMGRCVCWIRNTVADALEAQALVTAYVPESAVTLFHARFALQDRLAIEQQILDNFGKDSGTSERAGRVVIATQVAEQSLDADWDLLISDLAPIDRIIQRAGRMHRHVRDAHGRRLLDAAAHDQRGVPCLWVHGPEWHEEPGEDWFKEAFPKSALVYPHHGHLWRTAQRLRQGHMTMPEDARRFIEDVFGADDDALPEGLAAQALKVAGAVSADASQAQQNTVKLERGYARGGIDWWDEAKTPSRLGEASNTVVLVRWSDGRFIPWAEGNFPRRHAWAYSSLRVAERLIASTPEPNDPERKRALEALLEELPDKGRWSVVLPLEEREDGWVAEAVGITGRGRESHRTWLYSSFTGLNEVEPGS